MKKIKVVILIIALILGSLNVAYASTISPLASTISPLNNAVNDVKVTFTISEDGTSNSTITVSPMRVGGIDYITITASIIKRSTSSKVKTWNSVRVEEHPYVGNFIFNKISSNVTMPSDFENPKVLGVDVKCGTPVLDIKNILREYGIFNSEISSFTNDCKYIMDLKTICTGDVVCDRIEFLYNSFKSFYFDYIVIGKCINEYHFPEKVVRDAYALLKRDGQMFLSLKNTYNVLTLLKMLGHDVCFSEHAVHYDVDDFYNLISNMGIDIQLVNVENLNANDIIIDFSSKIIDFAKPDEADKGEVLNRIIADKYWFKITKKN